MTLIFALVAGLLGGAQAWAGQRTPFSTHFQTASTVLVGAVESARPIQQSEPKAALAPVIEHRPADILPVYPCELEVRVRAVIKAEDPMVKPGSRVTVVWYLLAPECVTDYRGKKLIGRLALWLLRTESGSLRLLVDGSGTDNAPSVLPIETFSAETEQQLGEWKDPRLAVTYLILKPGAVVPENGYASSWLPGDVAAVAGYFNFLKVYRVVYAESDERIRGLIALEVAASGECLESARRASAAEQQLGEAVPHDPFLDRDVERRTGEADLRWMRWTTKEQLLEDLGTPTEAVDGLTMLACRTDARVKTRARDLLSQYFGIDPSALPCIPCE
jgi:hypothetical protein